MQPTTSRAALTAAAPAALPVPAARRPTQRTRAALRRRIGWAVRLLAAVAFAGAVVYAQHSVRGAGAWTPAIRAAIAVIAADVALLWLFTERCAARARRDAAPERPARTAPRGVPERR
jgi:hypothetical protein